MALTDQWETSLVVTQLIACLIICLGTTKHNQTICVHKLAGDALNPWQNIGALIIVLCQVKWLQMFTCVYRWTNLWSKLDDRIVIVCKVRPDCVSVSSAGAGGPRPPSRVWITRPKYRQKFYVPLKVATAVGIVRLNKQNISEFAYFDWWLKQKQFVFNAMPVAPLLHLQRFKEAHDKTHRYTCRQHRKWAREHVLQNQNSIFPFPQYISWLKIIPVNGRNSLLNRFFSYPPPTR